MRRVASLVVYNHSHCSECQGHFEKDYHGDIICSSCGLILNISPTVSLPNYENKQKPDNAEISEGEYDQSRYGAPAKGPSHFDKMVSAAYKKYNPKAKGVESTDHFMRFREGGNPNIFRGQWPRLQFCSITKESFYARELMRIDPITGKKDYLCIVCLKKGMGKRAWHYLNKGKSQGYFEQSVLTAIRATSDWRAQIGLNPSSISDVLKYAERNFVLKGFNYANVRDVVNLYEQRGIIRTVNDQITGSRRIIMLRSQIPKGATVIVTE